MRDDDSDDSEWDEDPSLAARKRRMEARSRSRADEGSDEGSGMDKRRRILMSNEPRTNSGDHQEEGEDEELADTSSSSDAWSALKGVKRQSRYEPELPDEVLANWSKEELSEWRKSARKVRNRESAAASRRKTRERITELEAEVEGLKKKYQAALDRISVLTSQQLQEAAPAQQAPASVAPPSCVVSPELAPALYSPPDSPRGESWSLSEEGEEDFAYRQGLHHRHHYYHHHQHLPTISRPTAVCV
jgi:hypothetical protein